MPEETKRRPQLRFIGFGIFALLVPILVWQFPRYQRIERMSGAYLINGGRSLIVLDRGVATGLNWTNGRLLQAESVTGMPPGDPGRTANLHGDRLSLVQTEKCSDPTRRYQTLLEIRLELRPSMTVEGDWDLLEGSFTAYSKSISGKGNEWQRFIEVLQSFVGGWGDPDIHAEHRKDRPPIDSYLHRVDHPGFLEYFERRSGGDLGKSELLILREAVSKNPDDLFLQLHLIDVEARVGDLARAAGLAEKWRGEHLENANTFLRDAAEIVFKSVAHAQGDPSGDDLSELVRQFTGTQLNLETRIERIRDFLQYKTAITETVPLVEPSSSQAVSLQLPNYLDLQVNARVIRTIAELGLFQGRDMEGFELLAGLYTQGQLMNANGVIIQRLIGIANHLIADAGLRLCLFNAIDTEEEANRCIEILNGIYEIEGRERGADFTWDEWPAPIRYMEITGGTALPNYLEMDVRHQVGETRLALLRTIAAAKLYLLRTGGFPEEKDDLAGILGTEFPTDPFAEGALSMIPAVTDSLTLYSIGPDEVDGQGTVQYSPTNGTKSTGDIFVRVPKTPEYPFPSAGFQARNATDVLEQFPNGFPQDIFALKSSPQFHDWSYGIYEPTGAHPLRIFSRGPDGLEPHSYQQITYYEMPGGNILGPNDPGAPIRQPVYSPPTQPDGAPVAFDPLVHYDPTNGTKSGGVLFVEIGAN